MKNDNAWMTLCTPGKHPAMSRNPKNGGKPRICRKMKKNAENAII
jgi:hypothetical protein